MTWNEENKNELIESQEQINKRKNERIDFILGIIVLFILLIIFFTLFFYLLNFVTLGILILQQKIPFQWEFTDFWQIVRDNLHWTIIVSILLAPILPALWYKFEIVG